MQSERNPLSQLASRLAVTLCAMILSFFLLCSCSMPQRFSDDENQVTVAVSRVLSSVVKIEAIVQRHAGGRSLLQRGTGAGVIITKSGEIVTNYHVVANAIRIRATLHDSREIPAEIIGLDPWTDLAVIKLEAQEKPLPYAEFADSTKLKAGATVYTIGSPRSMKHTVNKGIVSSPRRFLGGEMYFEDGAKTGSFTAWIQTDALVESGSSGGPLVDSQGKIVGIVARSYSGGSGFAVPASQVAGVVSAIREKGVVERGWLGVRLSESNSYLEAIGKKNALMGAVIAEIDCESPLNGMVSEGEVIVSINGEKIVGRYDEDLPELRAFISKLKVASIANIEVWNVNGSTRIESVVVGSQAPSIGERFDCEAWGLTVRGITREMRGDFGLLDNYGAYITGVREGGPAAEAEIGGAYVIRNVNGKVINTIADLKAAYEESLAKGIALIVTSAGKFRMYHSVEFESEASESAEVEIEVQQ